MVGGVQESLFAATTANRAAPEKFLVFMWPSALKILNVFLWPNALVFTVLAPRPEERPLLVAVVEN